MDGRDGMRAADADRQVIADRLRVALDEGRLNLHEYDERLQRAYAARTYADLDDLVRDLPAAGAVAPTPGAVPAQRAADGAVSASDGAVPASDGAADRTVTVRWLVEVWEPWLKTVGIVVAIWAVTSFASRDLLYFWPAWVAAPWGAILLVQTVTGLVGGEPRRWAAERERRRQRRAEKRAVKRDRKAARHLPHHGRRSAGGTEALADAQGPQHDLGHQATEPGPVPQQPEGNA
ncbi:DUF1707 domain-containing protein [Verrucosispora sp. ts21]|uniref:DUF1707 SHOCT-like domain-containing protein n=1 Tax=Verrucosispora sp. ts21 TaxID=2069341 RepID=UPI0018EA5CBD|nr:DUF1707 domain-containing protein [Verrucosispora sp. ts21]